MRAIAYTRVSTDEQGQSGLGLEAQIATIEAEAQRKGWTLDRIYSDVASGKSMRRRVELADALRELESGRAEVLIVAKLDRLSRSVSDFAAILAQTQAEGWALNICDLGVDTTTPSGKMVAQIMMVLAEWEREMIGDRTKSALRAARARGTKLGRPTSIDPETVRLIQILRSDGRSLRQIATLLNDNSTPTSQGGAAWHASTVKAILERV